MDWRWWAYAKSRGVKCVINCDAHREEHAAYLRLGAGIARKGGLTRDDVINTLSLPDLRQALSSKRHRKR
jgi:DNA polymerase (family 10)